MVGNPTEGEHIEQGFLSFAQQETADRDGFYIAPTVLTNVMLDTEAAQEEIFESEDGAINRAHQTPHGLSASVSASAAARPNIKPASSRSVAYEAGPTSCWPMRRTLGLTTPAMHARACLRE